MDIAIREAEEALNSNNYPIGAVLVVNGEMIGKEQNRKDTRKDRISHAETLLYIGHSQFLKKAKSEGEKIELYTTFEPCLMCLGMAVIHRTNRIVVACPDPRGDTTQIDPERIGQWYKRNWPVVDYGLRFDLEYSLFMKFLETKNDPEFQEVRELFPALKKRFA